MVYGRRSLIVRAGRTFQRLLGCSEILDRPFRIWLQSRPVKHTPLVCLLSPPRCGSTLTYQVLCAGIENIHLTNLWNLLYRMPAAGALLSHWLCRHRNSTFESQHGFVPGLCGEAEGLRFWQWWSGQSLQEDPASLRMDRLKELASIVNRVAGERESYVTGYLGHVFCVEQLRQAFRPALFIHLRRDILSNAYSILRLWPYRWGSSSPIAHKDCLHLSRPQQAVEQVILIHQLIRRNAQPEDTIIIDYGDLCRNPRRVIREICEGAAKRGITLYPRNPFHLPDQFSQRICPPDRDEDSREIHSYLTRRIEAMPVADREYFLPLASL